MGGRDKPLLAFAGATLLDHVLAALAGQGSPILLSANGDPARFARFGLPVLPDLVPDQPGPLAGLLAGLEWLELHAPATRWLVTVPADTPFLPRDLVARLHAARHAAGAALACAESAGRAHPVVALWPAGLGPELRHALVRDGVRRVGAFAARHSLALARFEADPDPFANLNTPAEIAAAEVGSDARGC